MSDEGRSFFVLSGVNFFVGFGFVHFSREIQGFLKSGLDQQAIRIGSGLSQD